MISRNCLATLVLATGLITDSARADDILFNRDIRPILTDNCFACHGPDANQRQAELRLDVRAVALEKKAIIPGRPEESELIARIESDDPDARMPPAESNKSLSQQQKDLLRQWIADGAEYQGHWSFEPPVRVDVPDGAAGIDALVERDLSKSGLAFAEEADRRTLIRRLYFDLTGLPPKPEDVAAFVADQSPDAYGRVVETLLASPHYGERMAIGWLDVVRFADTIGYHSDTPRNVWPYRDYVIGVFNNNLPFDRFTIEQLAGDLLPGSTQHQQVASCFNRLLLTTEEGGAQAKDYEARMLTDRVRAVGTVWLGLTTGCCQCHDHKFDPLTTRDFYALGAFFADLQEPIIGNPGPGMLVPTGEQAGELARLQAAVDELQKQYDADTPELAAAQSEWEQLIHGELASAAQWTVLHPGSADSEENSQLEIEADGAVFAARKADRGVDTYRVTVKTPLNQITGFRLDVLPDQRLPGQGPGRANNGNFVVSEVSVTQGDNQPVALAAAHTLYTQNDFSAAAVIDGNTGKNNGWAIAGAIGRQHAIVFELAEPIGTADETALTFTIAQNHGAGHTLGKFRLSATTASPVPAPKTELPPQDILDIVQRAPAERDAGQQAKLYAHFKSLTPLLADLRDQVAAAQKARADYEATLPRCLVSTAMPAPRTVRILPRGNWQDESGEIMQPALPAFLSSSDPDAASVRVADDRRRLTRLDLAEWIVSPDNPLTARVFVNRLWKQFFGVALSKSTDDLGSQGEWPVHPELLDWLACEFRDSGWDVKHLVRTIVTTRTYRQSPLASPELLARDPDNRLLARQSRFRFDAELVRDNALAVSGLLVPTVGGPSVFPYQPEGYWENLNFPPRTYAADAGASQYRRGLYTWWQRTFTHPSLLAFDATSREECTADRTRSNIPQQALVLLNDPTYVEAARAFAARILASGGNGPDARIAWACQQALQREPRDDERSLLRQVYEKHRAEFAADPQAAEALLKVGLAPVPQDLDKAELAAWTSVARILLNLHETITRT